MKRIGSTILILSIFSLHCLSQSAIPFLKRRDTTTQLIVDGKPFLILGGELHNSSSSNLNYVKPLLAQFAAEHLNTALASVCWDMVEPREGKFDFSLVDGLIKAARANHLRLVLLWFGSWKNGVSTYVPEWVKTNQQRFPRVQRKNGQSLDMLSTFSQANVDADAKAFAAFMAHLRLVDGVARTVLMIQVENEVGNSPESRDHSAMADNALKMQVPTDLTDLLVKYKAELVPWLREKWEAGGSKTSGTWEDIFGTGDDPDELFMSWSYARYCGQVAKAGKAKYALPMYVNTAVSTWQKAAPNKVGVYYPSGGAMPRTLDIWRAGAPAIDILAPDIYNFFDERPAEYHTAWNALFIPEMGRDESYIGRIFYSIGQYDAIGVAPFGIESVPKFAEALGKSYELLASIAPIILANQGNGTMGGIWLDKDHPKKKLRVGSYTLNLGTSRSYSSTTPEYPVGIFIQTGPDEYLVAGRGITVGFTPETPGDPIVGLVSVEEGKMVNGHWIAGRRLNGDEILSGHGLRLDGDYTIQKVKLYRYH
jgi:hypothetical protein